MRTASNRRFFGEAGFAALCAAVALLTAVWPDWIEEAFGVDIDQHSGALEWLIVVTLVALGGVSGLLARIEWRRLRQA